MQYLFTSYNYVLIFIIIISQHIPYFIIDYLLYEILIIIFYIPHLTVMLQQHIFYFIIEYLLYENFIIISHILYLKSML